MDTRKKKQVLILCTVYCLCSIFSLTIWAQDSLSIKHYSNSTSIHNKGDKKGKGSIQGAVKDVNGNILSGANVIIFGTNLGDATDITGYFDIENLLPGEYKLTASHIGYKSDTVKVYVSEDKTLYINIFLKPFSFMIGGIEVIGSRNLLPGDIPTSTTITSGEIEHYQALSIKDVLDLVPGIQKSDNPNLDQISRAALRSDDVNRNSTFGTLIIIDNVPVSNNANLQFENNYNGNLSNVGGGVDLRTIPADNIDLVEVVTGLPSVKYGDMTEGVIKIQTKIGKQPFRIKMKSNPGTQEGNFSGGFNISNNMFGYNINYARSERDIRIKGDEYSRLTAQSTFSNNFLDSALNLNYKINVQKIFDDQATTGDILKIRHYDRGYSAGFSSWGKMNFLSDNSSLEYSGYVNLRKQNSLKERLVISDYRVLPDGDTVSNYVGRVETRGNEWSTGGNLEFKKRYINKYLVHNLLLGTEIKYDANSGEGVVLDTLFNYYGPDSGIRPYSFNDIPGLLNTSIYAEDKIHGKFFFNYILQFGFRYEMYRPYKLNLNGLFGNGDIVKSHNGSFFNPRLSFLISLSKNNQVRFTAGRTSKSPALSTLFPRYKILNWRNPADGKIFHLRYNLHVPDLIGITENQLEVAYDFSISDILGVSVSAYYKERKNENEGNGAETASGQDVPIFVTVPNSNNKMEVIYLGSFKLSENLGWSYMRGIEFKIRTVEIKPLNMKLQVTGSYSYINASRNGTAYYENPDSKKGQYPNYKVPGTAIDTLIGFTWVPEGKWTSRLQFNYYLTYTLEKLGLWVTLRAENLPVNRYQKYNLMPVNEDLTNEGYNVYNDLGNVVSFNNKWLFDINISKALYKGAEVSFYVNNFLDDPAGGLNPGLFYGIEFSSILEDMF